MLLDRVQLRRQVRAALAAAFQLRRPALRTRSRVSRDAVSPNARRAPGPGSCWSILQTPAFRSLVWQQRRHGLPPMCPCRLPGEHCSLVLCMSSRCALRVKNMLSWSPPAQSSVATRTRSQAAQQQALVDIAPACAGWQPLHLAGGGGVPAALAREPVACGAARPAPSYPALRCAPVGTARGLAGRSWRLGLHCRAAPAAAAAAARIYQFLRIGAREQLPQRVAAGLHGDRRRAIRVAARRRGRRVAARGGRARRRIPRGHQPCARRAGLCGRRGAGGAPRFGRPRAVQRQRLPEHGRRRRPPRGFRSRVRYRSSGGDGQRAPARRRQGRRAGRGARACGRHHPQSRALRRPRRGARRGCRRAAALAGGASPLRSSRGNQRRARRRLPAGGARRGAGCKGPGAARLRSIRRRRCILGGAPRLCRRRPGRCGRRRGRPCIGRPCHRRRAVHRPSGPPRAARLVRQAVRGTLGAEAGVSFADLRHGRTRGWRGARARTGARRGGELAGRVLEGRGVAVGLGRRARAHRPRNQERLRGRLPDGLHLRRAARGGWPGAGARAQGKLPQARRGETRSAHDPQCRRQDHRLHRLPPTFRPPLAGRGRARCACKWSAH